MVGLQEGCKSWSKLADSWDLIKKTFGETREKKLWCLRYDVLEKFASENNLDRSDMYTLTPVFGRVFK